MQKILIALAVLCVAGGAGYKGVTAYQEHARLEAQKKAEEEQKKAEEEKKKQEEEEAKKKAEEEQKKAEEEYEELCNS